MTIESRMPLFRDTHPANSNLVYAVFTIKWIVLLILHLPQVVALGLNSTSGLPEKHDAHITTTLPYSHSDSYPQCKDISWPYTWPGGKETYCWADVSVSFNAPLATSVACNSITYMLSQSHGWDKEFNVTAGTAVIKQLFTPTESDLEFASMSQQWDVEGVPRVAFGDGVGPCGSLYGLKEETPNNTFKCEIYAENVHLLYFPPDLPLSRDMCATTPLLTVTDFGNAKHVPQTVLNGTTLYKDRVYVSVDKIHAWTTSWSQNLYTSEGIVRTYWPTWSCDRVPLGTTVYNTIIELQSHEVSSVRVPDLTRYFPFNYADLVEPVPRSAWLGRSMQGRTSPYYFPVYEETTWSNNDNEEVVSIAKFPVYEPWLAMPTMVTSIDPEWATCIGFAVGWKDPPIALRPATSVSPPKISAIMSAVRGETASSRPPQSLAMPGSVPSQTPRVTGSGIGLLTPTTLAINGLGNNEQQNAEIASNEQAHNANSPHVEPSASGHSPPNGKATQLSRPSSTLAPGAMPYEPSMIRPGQPPFTLKNGQVVSAMADGLVVATQGHGMITIPYSALSTLANKPSAILPPQLDQLYSDISDALETLYPKTKSGPDAWIPSSTTTPGKIHSTRRRSGSSTSAGANIVTYIGVFGFWLCLISLQ